MCYTEMNIIDFFYNEHDGSLYVEFSLKKDENNSYRTIELIYEDIKYYSPTIIIKEDLLDIDNDFIIDLLNEYFKENDLPEPEFY